VEALQGEDWQGTAHLDVSEIVDRKSFEAWLEELPEERRYEWAVTLATRAALRVFPFWASAMREDWARSGDLTMLSLSRGVFTSAVAAQTPTADIIKAVNAGASNVDADYRVAADAASGRRDGVQYIDAADATLYATASAGYTDRTAEYAAHAVTYASVVATDYWARLRSDILEQKQGANLSTRPLWSGDMPAAIAEAWAKGRTWMEVAPGHAFWIRWYEAILAGRPLTQDWDSHWQLMHDIALIPDKEWGEGKEQDAIRVAGIIAEIEDKYRPTQLSNVDRSTVDAKLSTQEVQAGLRTNRLSLPPTLDAVFGHLELEIQRLSGINHWQTEEAFHEVRALIARLRAMQNAVDQLRVQAECLPEEPSMVDAEEAKSVLGQIYASLKSWPKGKEDELSDATWRIGLIGLTTGVFCLAGAPALVGAGVGGMFFGAKHLEQGAKAVKAIRAMQTEEKED
jgi:hypothetical protein